MCLWQKITQFWSGLYFKGICNLGYCQCLLINLLAKNSQQNFSVFFSLANVSNGFPPHFILDL
jgi:hypothetical protein